MKRLYILLFVLITTSLFAVSTRYINDFDFDKLSSFQLSNVSLLEGGGLTLSHDSRLMYSSQSILWSMAMYNGKMLVGTGDQASLIEIDGSKSREVFTSEGDIILSDIEVRGQEIYVSTLPQSRIVKMKPDYSIDTEWSVTNKYVWDIVSGQDELYILCGSPAAVYSISGGILSSIAELPQEQNIMSGLYYQKALYFAGENLLYRYNGSKAVALASFDNPIAGMIMYRGDIYLITSTHDPSVSTGPNGNGKNNSGNSSGSSSGSSYSGDSALYKIGLDGSVEQLYKKKNLQFVTLTMMGEDLIIGTAKDAGYLSYSLSSDKVSFSSLGDGKFITMVEQKGDIFGILLYPSRIMKIEKSYNTEGVFTSDVIDTENLSFWGTPLISTELMPGTSFTLSTRTGMVKNQELWEGWKTFQDSIASSPGRFIQYRVQLQSQGKNSPILKGLNIPFLQKNTAPRLQKIEVKYEKNGVKIEWQAEDANKDKLNYDIYLAQDEKEWVKLNQYPLNEDSYNLDYKSFPQGKYRVKVIARDDWSNPQKYSLDDYMVSSYFIFDNEVPQILDVKSEKNGTGQVVTFSAKDNLLPLGWSAYSVNGGLWKNLSPVDDIMDQKRESFRITLTEKGPLFLQILVRDSAGNEATQGIYLP